MSHPETAAASARALTAPSLRLLGVTYRLQPPSLRDPRLQVAATLLGLQVLGQTVLNFRLSIAQIIACLVTGAVIEFGVAVVKDRTLMWPASGLLTGNSVAIILRVPGTLHGDWWSTRGIWIFIGVVAFSLLTKYVVRWHGRHLFNPSNLGLVLAFAVLGPGLTEPQDLWWIPFGPWLAVTYALLLGGGLWVGRRLGLLGMQVAFLLGFAAFVAVALAPVPDHCMVASWRLEPLCGAGLWQVLATSPEVLVFALFMLPDPKTVPEGRGARIVFGLAVALFATLLLGPTILEFWTKTAILAGLVLACALRFPLAAFLAPAQRRRAPALILLGAVAFGLLPLAADASTRTATPPTGVADGTAPPLPLTVGKGPALDSWITLTAEQALPLPGREKRPAPGPLSTRLWRLPPYPTPAIAAGVRDFDPGFNSERAALMAHDAVLDLVIEAEARRTRDVTLATSGATGDGLKPFTDLIARDRSAGVTITTTYRFDRLAIVSYLPKYSSQASRLVGISLSGTATLLTRSASGAVLSQHTEPYSRAWALGGGEGHLIISTDYSDLTPAT